MQKYFLYSFLGFIFGVAVSSFELSNFSIFSFLLSSIFIFLFSRFFQKDSAQKLGFIISIFLLASFLGQLRILIFEKNVFYDLAPFVDKNITVRGEVFKESESNGKNQKVFINVMDVDSGYGFNKIIKNPTKKSFGKIVAFANLYPKANYGDVVLVKGVVSKPEEIVGEDGSVFNYPKFLLKDKISFLFSFATLNQTGESSGSFFIKILLKIKNLFLKSIDSILPEPQSSLATGIIFGEESISKETENIFRISGLSHIIVLSGYNITIVAESLLNIFLPLTTYAPFLGVLSIFVFVLVSGGGASAIRAGIMAGIAILGRRFGKTYSAGRALFFAGFLMVFWNPLTLLYDPSFHLSFLATVAIVYLSPIVSKKLSFVTERFSLRDIFSTTISAQVFVLPYIIFMTGKVSVFSFFSNILVLPLVPFSMFLGFWTGFLGIFSRILGFTLGFPLNFLLSYFVFVAEKTSKLPFSQVNTGHIGVFLLLTIYIFLGLFLWRWNKKK